MPIINRKLGVWVCALTGRWEVDTGEQSEFHSPAKLVYTVTNNERLCLKEGQIFKVVLWPSHMHLAQAYLHSLTGAHTYIYGDKIKDRE